MKQQSKFSFLLILLTLVSLCDLNAAKHSQHFDPDQLFLTWRQDPTTTMTVCWIAAAKAPTHIFYKARHGSEWKRAEASARELPDRSGVFFWTTLEGLNAATDYSFRFSDGAPEHRFRTLAADSESSIKFLVGGDMYRGSLKRLLRANAHAAKRNPDFVVLGGDIAYSANRWGLRSETSERWRELFSAWKNQMLTEDGRMIPVIATIGNHEVKRGYLQKPTAAAYFYLFFRPDGTDHCFESFDIGNAISLILLDSGHTAEVGGKQAAWLSKTLLSRLDRKHRLAVYHVPAYSARNSKKSALQKEIHKHWIPLFEENEISLAFEHHEHAYKRTVPINGVLYLGDGGWATKPRRQERVGDVWYLERTEAVSHFLEVELDNTSRTVRAVNSQTGEVFDEVVQKVEAEKGQRT